MRCALSPPSGMMKENSGRTRWTGSQEEPEWSETDLLILLNEVADLEADNVIRQLLWFQRWDIVGANCAALDVVGRNYFDCQGKCLELLSDYNNVRRRSRLSPELSGAIERILKGRQERGHLDLDAMSILATVENESRRKRQLRRKVFWVRKYLTETYKLKCALKRRRKQVEMQKSLAKVELDKNHGIEKPKLTRVGNITNSREENEEMLTLKLQELAIEIQAINAELADTTSSQNIEHYHIDFTRRQWIQEEYLKSIQEEKRRKKEEKYLKDFQENRFKKRCWLKCAAKRRREHIEMPLKSLAKVELDENHDIEKPKLTSVRNITNSGEENEEMLTLKLQELEIQVRGCLEHVPQERRHF